MTIHIITLGVAIVLFGTACIAWVQGVRSGAAHTPWIFFTLGALFLGMAEYIDVYTPVLATSIGLHQYFIYVFTLLSLVAFYSGFRRFFALFVAPAKSEKNTDATDARRS